MPKILVLLDVARNFAEVILLVMIADMFNGVYISHGCIMLYTNLFIFICIIPYLYLYLYLYLFFCLYLYYFTLYYIYI